MFAVFKKEIKSYLLTPIGYTFIGLFILMFSVFFFITIFQSKVINFEYLFYNGATILTFITPVLTMRMFSEEKKTGTDQLILTSPRSMISVTLGKFCAAAVVMLITEVLTLMYYFILLHFGKPSFLVAITTLLGFFLLSLAYISYGMFISSLTENQIIASVATIGSFLIMWFLPGFNEKLEMFSLINMFDKFPNGIISIREIVTFVTFTILFILLTIVVLKRRKSVK